jgi:glycosyltransferase involved in cell wall biosynthesis
MARPRTVHVTSPVAGFGNRLDLDLVCSLLEQNGFEVTRYAAVDRSKKARISGVTKRVLSLRGRFDVNLFLAPIFPEWLPLARRNVLIPNAEGFAQASWLRKIDLVLAKTRLTERIFRDLGCRTEFVSFTSGDALDESVPRDENAFFHSCSSQYKGTQRMLETWQRHPEWPQLTAVINNNDLIPPALFEGPNIRVIRERLPSAELRRLQNAHSFHLCCSEAEGFGHYIMEAMSCRAVTFTSDGAPMNELVQPSRGFLVACEDERPAMRFSQRHIITREGLEEQVARALPLDPSTRRAMGEAARAFFLENDRLFRQRFLEVMNAL